MFIAALAFASALVRPLPHLGGGVVPLASVQHRPLAVAPILRARITCQAAAAAADSEDEPTSADAGGQASFVTTVFNTCKAALGAGVLALPGGVATMGDVSAALVPASALIIGLGLISAYSFSLTARMCVANGAESLGGAWEKAIGKRTSWIVPSSLAALCLGVCVAYAIILGDTFSSLAVTAGAKGFFASRHASILVSAALLFPLCSLQSLAALAPSSILGVFGVFFAGGFLRLRLKQQAYAAGGSLALAIPAAMRPSFGVVGMRPLFPSSLVLISMVATAYQAHFSAPQMYSDLNGASIAKFNQGA